MRFFADLKLLGCHQLLAVVQHRINLANAPLDQRKRILHQHAEGYRVQPDQLV